MNKRLYGVLIAVLLAVGLVVGIQAAVGEPWIGAQPPLNLSHSQDVEDEANLAVGTGGRVAAIWTSKAKPGVFLRQAQDGVWETGVITLASGQAAWYPAVAYSGTQVIAAWAQGAARYPRHQVPRAVMQRDVGLPQAQTIITPVYGNIEISLVIAPTGMHMLFAAAAMTQTAQRFEWDLYYTHRCLTETTWAAPTIIITHAQVIPVRTPNTTAGVWEPQLAVNHEGTQLSVVWSQEHTETPSLPTETVPFTHTIWYVSGTWQAGSVTWAAPRQVSPPTQHHAVRPDVAVDTAGKAHIVWTELIPNAEGSIVYAAEQHINYLQPGAPAPVRISGEAVRVNNNKPTWATAALALSGSRMCVAWHGFYGPAEIQPPAEIYMRCSKDTGKSWQSIINVSASTAKLSIFPAAALDGEGHTHVVWTEFRLVDNWWVPDDLYYRVGTSEIKQVFLPVVLRQS